MKTFQIPDTKNADFTAKMNKFTKRAGKLGIQFGYDLVSTEQAFYSVEDVFGTWQPVFYTVYNYNVYGESPTINGYSFLAKIEPLNENTNLIHSHNADFDFSAYRSASLTCEHCNTNRFRNFYFLIQNDATGDVKMVGRNCLANYIGLPNAEEIAEFYAGLLGDLGLGEQGEEDENFGDGYRSGASWLPVKTIVTLAVIAVNNHGYVSKTAEKNNPVEFYSTASRVMDYLCRTSSNNDDVVNGDEEAKAEEIIAKISASFTGKNEYEATVMALISNGYAKYSHIGYVCSMVAVYNKMIETELTNKKNADASISEYLGEVGGKVTNLTGKVVYYNKFENTYGYRNTVTTHMYIFNIDGNNVKYNSSNDLGLEVGDEATIVKATVKAHADYKGTKQTVITRAKVETAESKAQDARAEETIQNIIDDESITDSNMIWLAVQDAYLPGMWGSKLQKTVKKIEKAKGWA